SPPSARRYDVHLIASVIAVTPRESTVPVRLAILLEWCGTNTVGPPGASVSASSAWTNLVAIELSASTSEPAQRANGSNTTRDQPFSPANPLRQSRSEPNSFDSTIV